MLIIEDPIETEQYRKLPVTFGMEIEQPPYNIPNRLIRRFFVNCHKPELGYEVYNRSALYDWCKDGSGPRETSLEPSIHILSEIKKFIAFIKDQDALWEWTSEYSGTSAYGGGYSGCGSHIHFRLREDMIEPHLINEAWATLYNTIQEVSLLMLPMFCHGSKIRSGFFIRKSAPDWAKIIGTRYSPITFARKYLYSNYEGRKYHWITPNKRHHKPLTIELRANESHPSIIYCLAGYITRIARDVFDRGMISPKLFNRNTMIHKIDEAYKASANGHNLYNALKVRVGGVRFLPGRGIPKLKDHYASYLDCFDDILKIHYLSRPDNASQRTAFLFRQRGEPWKNPNAIWNVLTTQKGEFQWDQPQIWSPDEIGGRLPKEPKV